MYTASAIIEAINAANFSSSRGSLFQVACRAGGGSSFDQLMPSLYYIPWPLSLFYSLGRFSSGTLNEQLIKKLEERKNGRFWPRAPDCFFFFFLRTKGIEICNPSFPFFAPTVSPTLLLRLSSSLITSLHILRFTKCKNGKKGEGGRGKSRNYA